MTETVIEARNVTKTYRTRWRLGTVTAVKDLNLTVQRGSVVAFVGPNGAGKSTTLYLLLGLLKQDSGSLRVFGAPPGVARVRRRIGFMSEIFYTYPFHTARSAMIFYGRLCGLSKEDAAVRAAARLCRLGLEAAAHRKVGTFSKGMTQRLGLAQSLVHEPDLLILDEPSTGLDPEGRRLVSEIIEEEKKRGTTVFLSSHILSDVERSCDEVVMIRDGQIAFSSDLAALTGASNEWRVEVAGLDPPLAESLTGSGYRVDRGEDRSYVTCPSERKKDLLRRLLDMPVEIGTVQPAHSLEDVYMQYLEEPQDE